MKVNFTCHGLIRCHERERDIPEGAIRLVLSRGEVVAVTRDRMSPRPNAKCRTFRLPMTFRPLVYALCHKPEGVALCVVVNSRREVVTAYFEHEQEEKEGRSAS